MRDSKIGPPASGLLRCLSCRTKLLAALTLLGVVAALVWWLNSGDSPREAPRKVLPDLSMAPAEAWEIHGYEYADKPSPLDRLDPARIPSEERVHGQPEELVAVIGQHKGRLGFGVTCLSYSPDGKWLASAGHDKLVHLLEASTLREIAVLEGHTKSINALAFSPDGWTLATGSADRTVRLWDLAGELGGERCLLQDVGEVTAVAYSPDGKTMAVGTVDAGVQLWEVLLAV
jgi:hypothetical protein